MKEAPYNLFRVTSNYAQDVDKKYKFMVPEHYKIFENMPSSQ